MRRTLSYGHKYLKDFHKCPISSKFNLQLTMENYSSNIGDTTAFVAEHLGKNTLLLW